MGRPSLEIWASYDEAYGRCVAFAAELQEADARTLPGSTLRAHGEAHLAEKEADKAGGLAALRSCWKHIERAPFIDDSIADIGQPAIDAWARSIRRPRGPLAPAYVASVLSLLSGICSAAKRAGTLAANPCTGLRLPREKRSHDPWTYLVPDEQQRLLTAPGVPEEHRLLIAFALGTGLREGETFSLHLADVHTDGATPHVWVRYGGTDLGPPKGGKHRRVPLFGLALAALRRWLEILPARPNPRGLVWPGARGGYRDVGHPLRSVTWPDGRKARSVKRDGWREALLAAGIVRAGHGNKLDASHRHDGMVPRWHDLRDTFATSALLGWWGGERWPIEIISKVLGHSSVVITAKHYAHVDGSAVDEFAAKTGVAHVTSLVGYGSDRPTTKQAAFAAQPGVTCAQKPLMHLVNGGTQNRRVLQGTEGLRTPPGTNEAREAAREGVAALAAGDAVGAEAALRALVDAVPAYRDVALAIGGGPLWSAAAARLFDAALERLEDAAGPGAAVGTPALPPRGRR